MFSQFILILIREASASMRPDTDLTDHIARYANPPFSSSFECPYRLRDEAKLVNPSDTEQILRPLNSALTAAVTN
jgi:hypothetical protein